MSNYTNIPTGLKITTQIPLNVKEFISDEATLANLGTNNNLAYTYHDRLRVYCFQEKTTFVWREVQIGEENTGLVSVDFVYPNNYVVYGIDYSNKLYNFFEDTLITVDNITDYTTVGPVGPSGTNGTNGINGTNGTNGINGRSTNMTRESSTSNSISIASKTFGYDNSFNLGWTVGTRLRCVATSGVNYMEGYILVLSSTSVTIVIDYIMGSGTFSNWILGIAGDPGKSANNLQKIVTNIDDTYTLTSADNNYTIIVDTGTSSLTIIVQIGLIENFVCAFIQRGTGDVLFNPDPSVTIHTPIGMKIKGRYYAVAIEQKGVSNEFFLLGNTKL